MNDTIEKPWVVYEYGGAHYIGKVVGVFPNSIDIAYANFDRTPKSYCNEQAPDRFSTPQEALDCAISRGSKREQLLAMLKEGFPDAKLEAA